VVRFLFVLSWRPWYERYMWVSVCQRLWWRQEKKGEKKPNGEEKDECEKKRQMQEKKEVKWSNREYAQEKNARFIFFLCSSQVEKKKSSAVNVLFFLRLFSAKSKMWTTTTCHRGSSASWTHHRYVDLFCPFFFFVVAVVASFPWRWSWWWCFEPSLSPHSSIPSSYLPSWSYYYRHPLTEVSRIVLQNPPDVEHPANIGSSSSWLKWL
jgi:hypothetical protein